MKVVPRTLISLNKPSKVSKVEDPKLKEQHDAVCEANGRNNALLQKQAFNIEARAGIRERSYMFCAS